MPIKFIISSSRLNYLHNILSRNDTELVSRIFATQCENPLEGDLIKLIEADINKTFDKNLIKSMTKRQFKIWVKIRIEKAAFNDLIQENENQSKI